MKVNKRRIFLQILCILCIYCFFRIMNIQEFYNDSKGYWSLGNNFWENHKFSFLNYQNPLRGYLFPFIIALIFRISTILDSRSLFTYWFVFSIIYGIMFYSIIPNFFSKILKKTFLEKERILFVIFSLFFWRGLFCYPLTDVLSVCFYIISLYFCLIFQKNIKKLYIIFFSGISMACAYYIRPVYLIGLIVLPFLLIYYIVKMKKISIVPVLVFILGFFIVAIPQILINKKHFGTSSFSIQTSKYYEENHNQKISLYMFQIFNGIKCQKYETNVNFDIYEIPNVFYYDKVGGVILKDEKIENFSYGKYIELMAKNPVKFLVIYFNHAYNAIDIKYPEIYIKNIYKDRDCFSILNYSIWFLFFIHIKKTYKKYKRDIIVYDKCIFMIYLLPAVLVIPTTIETRFFFSIHLVAYFFAILEIKEFFEAVGKIKIMKLKNNILYYVIFIIISLAISYLIFNTITKDYSILLV